MRREMPRLHLRVLHMQLPEILLPDLLIDNETPAAWELGPGLSICSQQGFEPRTRRGARTCLSTRWAYWALPRPRRLINRSFRSHPCVWPGRDEHT